MVLDALREKLPSFDRVIEAVFTPYKLVGGKAWKEADGSYGASFRKKVGVIALDVFGGICTLGLVHLSLGAVWLGKKISKVCSDKNKVQVDLSTLASTALKQSSSTNGSNGS